MRSTMVTPDDESASALGGGPTLEALFSYGFRPFFLGASTYAMLLMPAWIAWIISSHAGGGAWLAVPGGPFAWHAHELVFGFACAAIAGFLLTAVPNWTGALPISGTPLVSLFALWLAGRFAMTFSPVLPQVLVASLDLAFLPCVGAVAARQLFARPAARNLVFLVLLAVMTAANAHYHAATSGLSQSDPLEGPRAALLVVAVMICIIGGRIVPAFTHNWLHLNRPDAKRPVRSAWLDGLSVASFAAFAVSVILLGPGIVTGMLAVIAALANGIRLWLWHGWATLSEPIVWVLHLGYAWLVAGAALYAGASLTGMIPVSLALHGFATGAAGTMTLAVMSRASLGHTGRALKVAPPVVWAYVAITVAALLRVLGPLLAPNASHIILSLAGIAWTLGFALFVVTYAPILTTPRVRQKTAA